MDLRPFAFVLLFMLLWAAHVTARIRTLLAKGTVRTRMFLHQFFVHNHIYSTILIMRKSQQRIIIPAWPVAPAPRRRVNLSSLLYFSVKAWTVQNNTFEVVAAGNIHSDIERGFIRAEVISYANLLHSVTCTMQERKGS